MDGRKYMAEKKGFIKKSFGSMFNVTRWIAWGEIVGSSKIIWGITRNTLTTDRSPKDAISETFEEAIQRLALTEDDIKIRQKTFLRNSIVYLIISMLLFAYVIYLLVNGYILATFTSLLLTSLVLVYAYREHFWYTQMKHRKLGLNFKIWWRLLFNINTGMVL
jgi:intracellular multiplication protein IcmV